MPSLLAVLGLDANPFKSGLSQAQILANRTGKSIGSALTSQIAGFLSVAAVGQLARGSIAWASNLRDVADSQRVNVEWFQKLVNGAEQYGGKLEDVEKLLDSIGKSRSSPGKEQAAAFNRLGFSAGDVSGMNRMDFVEKLIASFKGGFTDQAAADLELVGGKSARNLLGAFAAQFENDVPILAEDLVNQLDDIGDKFTKLATTMKVGIAPAVISIGNAFDWFIKKIQLFGSILGGFQTGFVESTKTSGALGLFTDSAGFAAGGAALIDELVHQSVTGKHIEDAKAAERTNRKSRESALGDFAPAELSKLKSSPAVKALQLNSLQQVGAYVAQSPDRRMLTNAVVNIQALTKTIARNTEPQLADPGTKF